MRSDRLFEALCFWNPKHTQQNTMEGEYKFKNLSTCEHYPEEHHVIALINGEEKATFTLNLL